MNLSLSPPFWLGIQDGLRKIWLSRTSSSFHLCGWKEWSFNRIELAVVILKSLFLRLLYLVNWEVTHTPLVVLTHGLTIHLTVIRGGECQLS